MQNCVFVIVKQMPLLSIITTKKTKNKFVCACVQFVQRQNNKSTCTQVNKNNYNKNVEKLIHF